MNYIVKDIINFCEELFPGISPYTAENARQAIKQFELEGKTLPLTMFRNFDYLTQGDVFSEMPLTYIDKDGNVITIFRKAILLCNTCDSTRNDKLQFAAIHPVEDLGENESFKESVRHNRAFQFLYLPDPKIDDSVIDFGIISTISREAFDKLLQQGKVNKIASLSQVGYYMLLSKLTVYFMRPEDTEVNDIRGKMN